MRLLLHTLVTLTAAAILAGVALFYVNQNKDQQGRDLARAEVTRFQQQIHLRSALASADEEMNSVPGSIDPSWFGEDHPVNPLLGPSHPWVEVAGPDEMGLLHPLDPTASDPDAACFWYNPFNGIVRARVPMGISDSKALDLYNEVNDCSLESLFAEP